RCGAPGREMAMLWSCCRPCPPDLVVGHGQLVGRAAERDEPLCTAPPWSHRAQHLSPRLVFSCPRGGQDRLRMKPSAISLPAAIERWEDRPPPARPCRSGNGLPVCSDVLAGTCRVAGFAAS